ncbi:hypothetical protein [Methanobrevibacter sp. V14]|nr:hypothetical protein [Methanobrevibacter sp. V14]
MDRAEKDKPECEHYDAIAKPLALAPCASDGHIVFLKCVGIYQLKMNACF